MNESVCGQNISGQHCTTDVFSIYSNTNEIQQQPKNSWQSNFNNAEAGKQIQYPL